jgi:cytochrome c oxidase subunit 2
MEQRDFDNWLSGNVSGQTPVEAGKDLFENKLGCASCHAGGPAQRGAKLEGIYGHDVKLVGGATVKVDDQYIRNSILNPTAQIVEGFQPIMPTFKGQVTEEQLNSLVAYIKSLTPNAAAATTAPGAGMAPPANAAPAANKPVANGPAAKPAAKPAGNSNK